MIYYTDRYIRRNTIYPQSSGEIYHSVSTFTEDPLKPLSAGDEIFCDVLPKGCVLLKVTVEAECFSEDAAEEGQTNAARLVLYHTVPVTNPDPKYQVIKIADIMKLSPAFSNGRVHENLLVMLRPVQSAQNDLPISLQIRNASGSFGKIRIATEYRVAVRDTGAQGSDTGEYYTYVPGDGVGTEPDPNPLPVLNISTPGVGAPELGKFPMALNCAVQNNGDWKQSDFTAFGFMLRKGSGTPVELEGEWFLPTALYFVNKITPVLLDPDSEYSIKAFATNDAGTGWSEEKQIITGDIPLPVLELGAPSQTAPSFGKIGVNVMCNVSGDYIRDDFTDFWFTMRKGSGSPDRVSAVWFGGTTLIFNFENIQPLDPDTEYTVKAYAVSAVGTAESPEILFRTNGIPEPAALAVTATPTGLSTASVTWTEVTGAGYYKTYLDGTLLT